MISAAGPASRAALRDLTPRVARAFAFSLPSMAMTAGALLATSTAALTVPIWPGWRPQFWLAAGFGFIVLGLLPQGASALVLGSLFAYLGLTAGLIYPAFCALMSENAEEISPFAVARAFGIMNIISNLGVFVLNFAVPWVRENYGWQVWMLTSGVLCVGIPVAIAFGRGPWLRRRPNALMPV